MKKHLQLIGLASIFTSSLLADTIELKSGVTYQGKVISEDDKSYLLEIHYSASIKDERRIPKSDVRQITRDAKDAEAFKAVKASVPTPDMLGAEAYAKRIQLATDFLKNHPKSKHAKQVQTILTELQNEQKVIAEGGMKLNGQLVTASETRSNAYEIHARLIGRQFKKLARTGQYGPALRRWDKLQKYTHSSTYKACLPLIPRVCKSYEAELTQLINSLDARLKKRETVLASLAPNDQARSQRLMEQKQARYAATLEKERNEMRTKWLTIDPFHKQSLEYNRRNAQNEAKRVARINPSDVTLAGPELRAAWAALDGGQLPQAEIHMRNLQSMRLPSEYTQPLVDSLAEKKQALEAAEKAAKEAAEASPEPQTDEETTTPGDGGKKPGAKDPAQPADPAQPDPATPPSP